MKPIAIFYHCIVSDGSRPIDTDYACKMVQDQMGALKKSGLLDAAKEFTIGINGGQEDRDIVRLFAPPKAKIVFHGRGATTEIPTLNLIRAWLAGKQDWYVWYHHTKGVTHPGLQSDIAWKWRMEKAVIWGWRECVYDLDNGRDAVGCHWLTPDKWGEQVPSPFFGGNFWAAKSDFLRTLPPLPPPLWENRYEAERWIGRGAIRPKVQDYNPGWPPI